MTNEREPLWSDERIINVLTRNVNIFKVIAVVRDDMQARIAELEQELAAEREKTTHYYRETAAIVAETCAENERLKAQLAAERTASRIADANLTGELTLQSDKIKALKAQLAQRWEPLPDGIHPTKKLKDYFEIEGEWLTVTETLYDDGSEKLSTLIELPDNIRLCRLVERDEMQPQQEDSHD